MIFDDSPTLDTVLASVAALQASLNGTLKPSLAQRGARMIDYLSDRKTGWLLSRKK